MPPILSSLASRLPMSAAVSRHGWWRLAPVILVIVLGAFAWRIFQKWQLEREDVF